jgi:hypothetical protein
VFGPFGAGDSFRVYRLQRKGISLDPQRGLTQPQVPLREAWLAFLTQQAMGQPTYVLYDPHDGEAFVQLRYRPHQAAADVTYLAPSLSEGRIVVDSWSRLLDGAGIEAASQGIQRMFGSVPDSDSWIDTFHQVGFTPYAREDIYYLSQVQSDHQATIPLALRGQRAEDWPAIQKLCVAITPQRVRQSEGGIYTAIGREKNCRRYVLASQDSEDLLASLCICVGSLGHWLRLLIHPDAQQGADSGTADLAEALIRWALGKLERHPVKKVYCNVRHYESGVRNALESIGFTPYMTRSLMVKHTVAWVKSPLQELAPALKGGVEAVPPAYHINGDPEYQASNGRLAAKHEV